MTDRHDLAPAPPRRPGLFETVDYEEVPPPAAPPSWPSRLRSAGLAVVAAAVAGTVLVLLQQHHYWNWLPGRERLLPAMLGVLVGAAAVTQLLEQRRRPLFLALVGVGMLVGALEVFAAAILYYVVVVVALARPRRRLWLRILVAVAAWLALPVAHWFTLLPQAGPRLYPTIIIWVGLLYSALYVLIQHRRAPDRLGLVDEVFYLVAPPRLLVPFFQPISPWLTLAAVGDVDLRRFARAVGLALYGGGLLTSAGLLYRVPATGPWSAFVLHFFTYYARAAGLIFLSIALFRALGCDLPSGFRWAFRSQSFADFFRRWNHYVRDAVLTLFYFPFLARLRRYLPRRAAEILAPYLAIFVGSFLLNDLLVPLCTSATPWHALRRTLSPAHLATLLVFWSAIILPRQFARVPRPQRGWAGVLRTARFLLLYLVLFRVVFGVQTGEWRHEPGPRRNAATLPLRTP
jgi:hypothetical protein